MASIRKRGERWQVQVRRSNGFNATRSFILRTDAERWARETEIDADRRALQDDPAQLRRLSVGDVLTRYRETVTPTKRSAAIEDQFLRAMLRRPIAQLRLADLSSSIIAEYRDDRLRTVKPASALRELAILQHALEVARREWCVMLRENPCRLIAKPSPGSSRQRRVDPQELDRLLTAIRADNNRLLGPAIRFAIETALRRGELLAAEWVHWNEERSTLLVPRTKNGHPRVVALSPVAADILNTLRTLRGDEVRIFPMTANALRLAWQRLRRRVGVPDLRFHDLRHEAVSRLFERGLNMPEVASISGHRDPRMLFRYTHPRAEDVARKLRGPVEDVSG